MNNIFKIGLIIAIVLLSIPSAVAPQDPYPLYGYVVFTNGTPVGEGANVTFMNMGTGEIIYDDTSASGWYSDDAANFPSGYQDGQTIAYSTVFGAYTNTTSHVIDIAVGSHAMNITVTIDETCTPPVISSLTNGVPATNSVSITWSTDISSNNRVKYSKNSDLSSSSWSTWQNSTTSINIGLTSLDSATPYYYQAWSYNSTNHSCGDIEPASQPYKTFTTANDPVYTVSGYVLDSLGVAIGTAYVVNNVTVDTDYTTSAGYYSLSLSDGNYQITASKAGYTSNYIGITVSGDDLSNNNITLTQPPCTTPVISDVANSEPTCSSTIVTWTINQSADNIVKYSEYSSLNNSSWSNWHNDTSSAIINIDGLTKSTKYYYQTWSYNGTNSSCVVTSPPSSPFKSFITSAYGTFEERMMSPISNAVSSSYAIFGALLLVIVAGLILTLLMGLSIEGQIDIKATIAGVIIFLVTVAVLYIGIQIFYGIGII